MTGARCGVVVVVLALLIARAPALEFEQRSQEVDAAPDATEVVVDFPFRNPGPETRRVVSFESSCSCIGVTLKDGKQVYAPGESGLLRAVFEVGNFTGPVDKQVKLWLDGDAAESPSVVLDLTVRVPELVAVEPKTLRWGLGEEPEPRRIELRVRSEEPLRVLGAKSSSPGFECRLVTVEEGRHYALEVTPADTERPGLGLITIETDSEIPRFAKLRAFAVVRRPLPQSP